MSFRKLITEGVDPEQNEEPKTLSKKKKPTASVTSLKLSQMKTKGKGGKGQKRHRQYWISNKSLQGLK